MTNEVVHAYAILGLAPGVSAPVIRQRCRIMLNEVRLHPAKELQQAEILTAYRTIRRHYGQIRKRVSESPSLPVAERSLPREEVEAFTDGIGNEGLLEPFLWPFRWLADLLGVVGTVVVTLDLIGFAGLLVYALLSRQPRLFFGDEYAVAAALLFLVLGGVMLFKRIWTASSR